MEAWREHRGLGGNVWAVAIVALTVTAGCAPPGAPDSVPPPPVADAPPPPPPASDPPTTVVREIEIGDTVEGRYTYSFGGAFPHPTDELHFVFTAPADGTVGVTLTWDVWLVGTIFDLTLDGVLVPRVPGVWSPVTGEMSVTAGTRYTIAVGLCCADEQFEDHPLWLSTEMR